MHSSFQIILLVVLLSSAFSKLRRRSNSEGHAASAIVRLEGKYDGYQLSFSNMHDSWLMEQLEERRKHAAVDVAIVCDKEFGDLFLHNRTKMLEYWTVRFYEVKIHFMQLTKVNVDFRVTSLSTIATIGNQPFIQRAINRKTGFLDLDMAHLKYQLGLYHNPYKYDRKGANIIVVATNVKSQWYGSIAHVGAVCKTINGNRGPYKVIFVNDPYPTHQLQALSGGLATILGDRPEHECKRSWYSVGAPVAFSECSDNLIRSNFRSGGACCIPRSETATTSLALDPDFDDVLPPSAAEQCKLVMKQKFEDLTSDDRVYVGANESGDLETCQNVTCDVLRKNGTLLTFNIALNENTHCGNGKRCFLGKCEEVRVLLVNVMDNQCLSKPSPSQITDPPFLTSCPRSPTPLDLFKIIWLDKESNESSVLLTSPVLTTEPYLRGDVCLSVRNDYTTESNHVVRFQNCETFPKDIAEWTLIFVDTDEFLLQHQITQKCVKKEKHSVISLDSWCNMNDDAFRWKFHRIYPEVGLCSENDCTADLQVEASFRNNILEEGYNAERVNDEDFVVLDIFLENLGEAAITPGVIVSWKMKLSLRKIPYNCFSFSGMYNFPQKMKCKLGRLLGQNETALVASLVFNMDPYYYSEETDLSYNLTFTVEVVTASRLLRPVIVQTEPILVKGMNSSRTSLYTLVASTKRKVFRNLYKVSTCPIVRSKFTGNLDDVSFHFEGEESKPEEDSGTDSFLQELGEGVLGIVINTLLVCGALCAFYLVICLRQGCCQSGRVSTGAYQNECNEQL